MLTLIDNRSSVQLAAAEGSARNMDFGAIGGLLGSAAGGVGGGYSNTAEGKVIVAAFTDSYNNLVKRGAQLQGAGSQGRPRHRRRAWCPGRIDAGQQEDQE